MMQNCDHY